MIKLIVFDLDDTLYDARHVTDTGNALASKAIAEALDADWKAIHKRRMDLAREIGPHFTRINNLLCKEKGLAEAKAKRICDAAKAAYNSADVSGISLFPGVREMLARLRKRYVLVLLSTGDGSRQQAKLKALGLQRVFEQVFVTETAQEKSSCLRQALEMFHFAPKEVLVVGDRIDSEIRAANELGMVSVQLVHGKYSVLKPKDRLEKPRYIITKITAVEKLVEEIE